MLGMGVHVVADAIPSGNHCAGAAATKKPRDAIAGFFMYLAPEVGLEPTTP